MTKTKTKTGKISYMPPTRCVFILTCLIQTQIPNFQNVDSFIRASPYIRNLRGKNQSQPSIYSFFTKVERTSKDFAVHEDYDPMTLTNDIAYIRFHPIEFSKYCLYFKNLLSKQPTQLIIELNSSLWYIIVTIGIFMQLLVMTMQSLN